MKYNPIVDVLSRHVIKPEPDCEYYAIGDVHGCAVEYDLLYTKIINDCLARGKRPRVIQLGDMIDRGPYFADLIINDHADFKVMGNHEYNFILEHYGYKPRSSAARNKNHDAIERLKPAEQQRIIDLLLARETYYTIMLDERVFVLSHAPIKDIEKGLAFLYKQATGSIPNYCMRSTAVDLEQLRQTHSNTTFVHGHQKWNYHDIEQQIESQRDFDVASYNIDSGCVYGGDLIALRLRDGHVLKVTSKINVDKL